VAHPAVNVLDPECYVDPWQAYRWLRDEAPVYGIPDVLST
jgi:cytochrome P450 family 142 subfamily A polypeptide 1